MKPLIQHLIAAALVSGLAATLHPEEMSNKFAPLSYIPLGNVGQALTDMEVAKHPEIKIIAIHVTPNGIADSPQKRCIMFSNIGRIGKPSMEEAVEVGVSNKETADIKTEDEHPSPFFVITAPPKYQVMTPLVNKAGEAIGLIVLVFPYKEGDDVGKCHDIAESIKAELKSRISSKDDLFKPAQ